MTYKTTKYRHRASTSIRTR